jgi:hypothetical protein
MRRIAFFAVLALSLAILLPAATLQKLTLGDMSRKSTAIVRARVLSSYAQQHGSIIYTHYRIQVSEWWKGSGAAALDVVVPGGLAGGLRQTISGAPQLLAGGDQVFFLWTGSSGLTHIIGLSQGLFKVQRDASGEVTATRTASTETVLDPASGQSVGDESLSFRLSDLHQRVSAAISTGGQQ